MYKSKIALMTIALEVLGRQELFPDIPDGLAGIDLETEYHLIKQKKSKLPKRMRERIVYRYERILAEKKVAEKEST